MENLLKSFHADSEGVFQSFFRNTHIGLAVLSLDFRLVYANEKFARVLGYSVEDISGKAVEDIISVTGANNLKKQLKLLIDGKKELLQIEQSFSGENNKKIYAVIETKLIYNESNEPAGYLSTLLDITQRKNSEHAILVQNRYNRELADFTHKISVLPPQNDLIQFILDNMLEITGADFTGYAEYYKENENVYLNMTKMSGHQALRKNFFLELINNNMKRLITINDDIKNEMMKKTVLYADSFDDISYGTAAPGKISVVLQRLLGFEQYIVLAIVDPLADILLGTVLLAYKNKEVLPSNDFMESLTNIVSDAIKRRLVEDKLLENQKILDSVLNSSNDGIILLNRDKVVLACNKGAEKIFGISAIEIIGKQKDLLFSKCYIDDQPADEKLLPGSLVFSTGRDVNNFILKITNRKNIDHWLKISAQPVVTGGTGKVEQAVLTFSEVTEYIETSRHLNNSLNKQNAMFDELKHRIKDSIAMIQSIIKLEHMVADSSDVKEVLVSVQNRITTFADLYSMFEYSRFNSDEIRMNDFLENVIESIKDFFQTDEYFVDLKTELNDISLSSHQAVCWGLILNELLTNAYKYAFKKGGNYQLGISFLEKDSRYEMKVWNNGLLLPEDYKKEGIRGFGFRLVGILAAQLKGDFDYESDSRQTVFTITGAV